MADNSPGGLARQLLIILERDRDRLERIDDYMHGRHDDPYMPVQADREYRLLVQRSVSNWCPLLVDTPGQAMYVDGFRPGKSQDENAGTASDNAATPEWDHWQYSRMDSRQVSVHKGALIYGHSFVATLKEKNGKVRSRGLSARRTAALYEDPANDDAPVAVLTIKRHAVVGEKPVAGLGTMWDGTFEYDVVFKSLTDLDSVRVLNPRRHGASECPVTRFAASVDLDGRTLGVVEPMIVLQNRINQTVFDLLVAQTYGSVKVRTVTGMAPPVRRDPETGEPILDADGNPVPLPINHNASRFMFAEDSEAKFGSLDETPLDGFISSIDMSIRHLSAISQVPPHHLLGQIANLSAEALEAAETSLLRQIQEFQSVFGESWERVFRIAAQLAGNEASAEDYSGEVIWRDMGSKNLAQAADALGKLSQQVGIPAQGLWQRVPGVTQAEIENWETLVREEAEPGSLAALLRKFMQPPGTGQFADSANNTQTVATEMDEGIPPAEAA